MPQYHFVIFKNSDGQVEKRRMKSYLRENLEILPEAEDRDKTSHTLRDGLQKIGWIRKNTADSVLMIRPDEANDTSFADPYIEGFDEPSEIEEVVEDAAEITFGLERDLQAALRSNINQLEGGLTIIDGGREKSTEAGRIDILAKDANGQLVIIELKAGVASPDVVAQTMAYMGSLAGEAEHGIRAIIIAGDFHKRVVLAARAIPNLILMKYSFRFDFGIIE